MNQRSAIRGGCLLACCLASGSAFGAAEFHPLPRLGPHDGTVYTVGRAWDISADGTTVVGKSYRVGSFNATGEAVRWTLDPLSVLPVGLVAGGRTDTARGVSADGSVIVGIAPIANDHVEAFRWEDGAITLIDDLPGGKISADAWGVSSDGTVVVGVASPDEGNEAFRWHNGTMVGLGYLPDGNTNSFAHGVSADGSVVVGYSSNSSTGAQIEAFRWEGGTMSGLGYVDEGGINSKALDVSADGSVVVGWTDSLTGRQAFRWEGGEMIGLGHFAPGTGTYASAVSPDGSQIVGHSGTGNLDEDDAFIWDDTHGLRFLQDVLVSEYALDLTGWRLINATGVSADNRRIVGYGWNPDGVIQGWVFIDRPPAVLGDLDGNGVVDAFDVDDFEQALSQRSQYVATHPDLDPVEVGDFNDDGFLDAFDVSLFEQSLAGGGATVPEPAVGFAVVLLGAMFGPPRGRSHSLHRV